MALEEKTVTIPMRFGQDEGTDKGSDLAGLMAIENGIYDKDGALRPRFGFQEEVSFNDPNVCGLVLADRTLGVVTQDQIKNYDPGSGLDPVANGESPAVAARTVTTVHGGRSFRGVDSAVTVGTDGVKYLAVVSGEESSGTDSKLWFRLFNYDTGTLLFSQAHATINEVYTVRAIATGTSFLFAWHGDDFFGSTRIQNVSLNPVTRTLGSENTTTTTPCASKRGAFDLLYTGGFVYIGYALAAEEFHMAKCTADGAVLLVSAATGVASHNTSQTVAVLAIAGFIVGAYMRKTPVEVVLHSFAAGDVSIGGGLSLGIGSSGMRNLAFDKEPSSTTAFTVLGSEDPGDLTRQNITFTPLTGAMALSGSSSTLPALKMVSKTFRAIGTDVPFVLVVHTATEEHLYLGVHALNLQKNNIGASLAVDEARPYNSTVLDSVHDALPHVNTVDSDIFAVSLPVSLESSDANSILEGDPLVYRARVSEMDFNRHAVPFARIEDVTYLAGGVAREFDGRRAQEASMMSAPPKPTLTAGPAGFEVAAGTYQYATVIEQTDRFGNIRFSPPSAVATITLGASAQYITVEAPNYILPVADLTTGLDDSRLTRVYRTAVDQSVFYLVHTDSNSVQVQFDDATADDVLSFADQLDVTGLSDLLSTPVPALRSIWSHGNRLFGVRAETPRVLSYTQSMEQPSAPSWSNFLAKTIETSGGDLVAGGSLPGKCILFQEDQVLVMGGRGPSNAGPDAGSDGYDDPEPVSNGVGAVDAVCIVPIPGGILFRAKTGFHVIGNDCSVTFVGQGVQDREASMGETTMAQYIPSFHQVWIAGENSQDVLVFDTRFGRWSTFSGPWGGDGRPVGVQEIAGVVYLLVRDASEGLAAIYTYQESSDLDLTAGVPDQVIDTPWFKGPGDGSTFRVWSVIVTVRTHGDTEYPDEFATPGVTLSTYTVSHNDPTKDQEAADGSKTYIFPEGDKAGIKQIRLRPNKQRCEAFRCRIEITGTSTPVSVVSVKYVYGVESEASKTPRRA